MVAGGEAGRRAKDQLWDRCASVRIWTCPSGFDHARGAIGGPTRFEIDDDAVRCGAIACECFRRPDQVDYRVLDCAAGEGSRVHQAASTKKPPI